MNARCRRSPPDRGFEIYVQPFPEGGRRHLVSRDGGMEPLWSRDGRELTYRDGERVIAVAVETEVEFSAGDPELLFEGAYGPPSKRFSSPMALRTTTSVPTGGS